MRLRPVLDEVSLFLKENVMSEYTSQKVGELAKALINVQRQLQPATRDANNPFTKSKYATLNSVMDSCREALLSNGIWLCQYPVPAEPGYPGLVTKLTHAESGQWQSSLAVVPLPKADPPRSGHQHDLHAPLRAFSHARYCYGGGYGRRVQPRQAE